MLRVLAFLWMIASCLAVLPAQADNGPFLRYVMNTGGIFPLQGVCTKPTDIDHTKSSATCGQSTKMLKAEYTNDFRLCVYVNNNNDHHKEFFIPLYWLTEWTHFADAVTAHQIELVDISLLYGCASQDVTDQCQQQTHFDDAPNGTIKTTTSTGNYTETWECQATGPGCGTWVKTGSSGTCGVCGASAGRTFQEAPTTNLCNPAANPAVSLAGNRWTWNCGSCAATGNTGDATCTACYAYKAGSQSCGSSAGGTFDNLSPYDPSLCPSDGSKVSDFVTTGAGWHWYCYKGSGETLTSAYCAAALTGHSDDGSGDSGSGGSGGSGGGGGSGGSGGGGGGDSGCGCGNADGPGCAGSTGSDSGSDGDGDGGGGDGGGGE